MNRWDWIFGVVVVFLAFTFGVITGTHRAKVEVRTVEKRVEVPAAEGDFDNMLMKFEDEPDARYLCDLHLNANHIGNRAECEALP